jgi:hypothetical protein
LDDSRSPPSALSDEFENALMDHIRLIGVTTPNGENAVLGIFAVSCGYPRYYPPMAEQAQSLPLSEKVNSLDNSCLTVNFRFL